MQYFEVEFVLVILDYMQIYKHMGSKRTGAEEDPFASYTVR